MKLYNRSELKHSRIFFDQSPPAFLTFFICFLAIIMVSTVFVSKVIAKPYIVRALGMVTTNDNHLISSQLDGEVVMIHSKEGQNVKAGDTLLTISNGQEGLQASALGEQLNELYTKLEEMDRYVQSLETQKNLMKNAGPEQEYYGKVEYYLLQVRGDHFESSNTAQQLKEKKERISLLENEINNVTNNINSLHSTIAGNDKLRQEIQTSLDQKQLALEKINEQLNLGEPAEGDEKRKKEIETELATLSKKSASIESKEESNAKKSALQAEIDTKKSEIESLSTEVKQLETQNRQPVSQAKQLYNQFISEIGAARSQVEAKLVELQSQMSVQNGQESSLIIKAKNDGVVHYLVPIKTGMSIQRNQVIAEVSRNLENDLQVEAYIPAQDISRVKIDDEVKVSLQGVNIQKYGTLTGKLVSIDSGTITQQTENGNAVFYKCLVSLENQKLSAKDGTVVNAIKSMPVEARIVYEKETYFEWVLKMLSFKS
jgi:membrane fusion protein, peptide pheromone/bacteriocin exporter